VCTLSIFLSFGYPCSRSPLSVSASSAAVAVTFTVVGRNLLLLHFSYLCPRLTVHMHMLPCPRSLLLPASISVSLLCYFFPASSLHIFGILILALALALLCNAIAIAIGKRQALLYLLVSFHSFGCLSLFVFTFHLPSFSFLLSPFTLHQPQLHNPTTPPLHLPIPNPLSLPPPTHDPRDPTTRIPPPHLACIPSLRFAFFSLFSSLIGVGVGVLEFWVRGGCIILNDSSCSYGRCWVLLFHPLAFCLYHSFTSYSYSYSFC